MSGMRMSLLTSRRGAALFLGMAAAALAAALPGCTTGDSTANPLPSDASANQTVDAPAAETGAAVDASLEADARADASDAAGPDAAEIADAEEEPEAAALCVPFDAGVLDAAVVEAERSWRSR